MSIQVDELKEIKQQLEILNHYLKLIMEGKVIVKQSSDTVKYTYSLDYHTP